MLYMVAAIRKPNDEQRKVGVPETILLPPIAVIAADERAAAAQAGVLLGQNGNTIDSSTEVLVRPF